GQEAGRRRHDAAGDEDRLDDDGRDLAPMLRHDAFEGSEIVEGRHQGPTREVALAVEPRLEVRIAAVIGADRLHDVVPPGELAGSLDGKHGGLRARVGKAYELEH